MQHRVAARVETERLLACAEVVTPARGRAVRCPSEESPTSIVASQAVPNTSEARQAVARQFMQSALG